METSASRYRDNTAALDAAESVRTAIAASDDAALAAALDALSDAERQATVARFARAEMIPAPPTDSAAPQIANLHAQAEQAVAQMLAKSDPTQRAALAAQLDQVAQQAAQQGGEAWQVLAAHLPNLAAHLGEA